MIAVGLKSRSKNSVFILHRSDRHTVGETRVSALSTCIPDQV